ncbi:MAG: cytochrome D1 domain-containing protein [Candidatus Acidiferrales bacterium]|jgi:YVTN family beta-propeller protein
MKFTDVGKRSICRGRQLGIPWLLLAMPLAAASSRVYVANTAGTSVSVIDTAKNKVVQQIGGIQVPEGVAVSPDGKRVYITEFPEKILTVVDRKTGKKIKDVPVSGHANDITVTRDGRWVLVCDAETPGGLDIVDAATLELAKSIPTKTKLHDIVVTADNKYAIATSEGAGTITVFDLQSQTIAWDRKFDMGTQVMAIESNPDGSAHRLFLQLSRLRGFAVVDFEKREEVERITFPDDQPTVVPSGSPSHGIGIAPDGKTLWANSRVYDCVFVYSLPDLKPLGRVHLPEVMPPGHDPIGGSPNWVTFTPDSKTVYISNGADRSVSAVDVKTMKVVARIPVGEEPARMATLALR